MRQSFIRFVQFALSLGIGVVAYRHLLAHGERDLRFAAIAALIFGVCGVYLAMKLYVLIRYGWKAAKSMTWNP